MHLRNLFFILFILTGNLSFAQSLTGTWEGDLDSDEFLQINIIQTGDKLCGYTYDYSRRERSSFCRAYFVGDYDRDRKIWFLTGTSFMQNSGSHVLMRLKFKLFREGGDIIMNGVVALAGGQQAGYFKARKTSERPTMLTQAMRDCVAENNPPEPEDIKPPAVIVKPAPAVPIQIPAPQKKVAAPAPKSVIPKKKVTVSLPAKQKSADPQKIIPPAAPKPPVIVKRPIAIPKKDTGVKNILPPPVVKIIPKAVPLPSEISGRKNKEIGHIIVHDKKITLNLYDNGTVDGDTVSIYYNGRLLINHRRLSGAPITVDLTLDENTSLHSIVLFAENLGSIPPNTALVIFTTPSGKRYELFSSATLQQNAEIIFEYIPQ